MAVPVIAGRRRTWGHITWATAAVPDALVAVFQTEADLITAITDVEQAGYPVAGISVLGQGMTHNRHLVGLDARHVHAPRWAKWGGAWGWTFGSFILLPADEPVVGAFDRLLVAMGIPADAVPVMVGELRAHCLSAIAHGGTGEVEAACDLFRRTSYVRLDHYRAGARGVPGGGPCRVPWHREVDPDAVIGSGPGVGLTSRVAGVDVA
jgi:hypothetical protein